MEAADLEPPAFLRLAAHPLRWRLLTALATSDHRVRDLVDLLDRPQNLVSYHLRLLRRSGLVSVRRSSHDARDGYHHLDLERCAHALAGAGAALHPALHPALSPDPAPPASDAARPSARPRVLFACTGNSARSPVAAALLTHRSGGRVEAASAGSHPKPGLHPHAVRVMRERYGIDLAHRPRRLDTAALPRFDHLISLCDKVREVPELRGRPGLVHWSLPDPAAEGGSDRADDSAFRHMAAEIDTRVRYLLPALIPVTEQEARP